MQRFQDAGNGFVIAFCFMSLFQDALGMEGFIEHCRAYWLSAQWSVPLAVAALLTVTWRLARS